MNPVKRCLSVVAAALVLWVLLAPVTAFTHGDSPSEDDTGRDVCEAVNGGAWVLWLAGRSGRDECPRTRHVNYTFWWENDSWPGIGERTLPGDSEARGPDEKYTNGFFLESRYELQSENGQPLPGSEFFGFLLGSQIFTPVNLKETEIIANERPYAGLLFLGFFRERYEKYDRFAFLPYERRELRLSVVGRPALGETLQRGIHVMTSRDLPRGWHNQIGTDLGIMAHYSTYLFVLDASNRLDVAPVLRANLGNLFRDVSAGLQVRFGWLPPYYAAGRTGGDTNPGFNLYAFANAERKRVWFNATLQGGDFLRNAISCTECESPHRVPSNEVADYVTTGEYGLALKLNCCENGALEIRLSRFRQSAELSAARFNDDGHDWVRFTAIAPFGGG